MLAIFLQALLAVLMPSQAASAEKPEHWTTTWTAAPQIPYLLNSDNPTRLSLSGQTLRQIVRSSIGTEGNVRVRFSNLFGDAPLSIENVHAAVREKGEKIVTGTDRLLKFKGAESVVIPAGGTVVSDAAQLSLRPDSELAISAYFPVPTRCDTLHRQGLKTYVTAPGNFSSAESLPVQKTVKAWFFLAGVDVEAPVGTRVIAAIGDSLTDFADKLEPEDHARWTDVLRRRLKAAGKDAAVLNLGISGSRLLHDNPENIRSAQDQGLRRFRRDIPAQAGVTDVVVLLGTNDLGRPGNDASLAEAVSARQFTEGLTELIAGAHSQGLKIHGGTIPPFEGSTLGFDSAEKEKIRQDINGWIRSSGRFDGVVDFDSALRDPLHPSRMLPRFDSGDRTHPNVAGQLAMGEAVDLRSFGAGARHWSCPEEVGKGK